MSTAWYQQDARAGVRQFTASKVPEITALFWAIKILSTGMGEATSDYLVHTYNPYLAVIACAIVFAVAMAAQLLTKRYTTWIYWLAVVMVSVFGTMCADVTHIVFGVPYAVSTATFAVVLAVILTLWYKVEGTLSIHSIRSPRRELFYWATVLATFALGTATGDLTARTLKLGFLSSGIMFAIVFAIPAIGNWKLGMNPILAFWFAYIVTRPLGASFADWLGLAHVYGGLGYGDGLVSGVAAVLIVILVAVLAVTGQDVEGRESGRGAAQSGRGGRHRSPAGASGPEPTWSAAAASPGYLPETFVPGSAHGGGPGEAAYDYGRGGQAHDYGSGGQAHDYGSGGQAHGGSGWPEQRYGPGDRTRRLSAPGGSASPPRPGAAGPGPVGDPRPPADQPRLYGHGDTTRPLDRRGPPSPGSPDRHYANGRSGANGYPASGRDPGAGREPGGRKLPADRPDLWPPFQFDEEPPTGPRWPEDDQAGW